MIIVLAAGAGGRAFSLELPREFDRFHLEVRDPIAGADLDAALRAGGVGWAEDEHAWIEPAALRELAGPDRDAEWEAGLEAMLVYASGQGWTRDGAVRAHVERP